jgi:hypothetical protein
VYERFAYVAKDGLSEDKIYARLRELTDATRQVRKDLEDLIRDSRHDWARGLAHDSHVFPKRGRTVRPQPADEPEEDATRPDDPPRGE